MSGPNIYEPDDAPDLGVVAKSAALEAEESTTLGASSPFSDQQEEEEDAVRAREGLLHRKEADVAAKRKALADEVKLHNGRYAEAERRIQRRVDRLERLSAGNSRAAGALTGGE
ncbi:hypothetical protein T484DRAFT_1855297 [Baffinella frigidus]|nr:hypothetical protein T484DRAFT_1855297 [Cryptophyta sp. CCMP2293]